MVRRAAAVLIGRLLLAGCGDGGREEFVREAEANCKQRQTEVVRSVQEGGGGELGDYLRLMQESVKQERAAFGYDASEYNEQSVATAKARRAGVQARRLAEDMGLPTCADALY